MWISQKTLSKKVDLLCNPCTPMKGPIIGHRVHWGRGRIAINTEGKYT